MSSFDSRGRVLTGTPQAAAPAIPSVCPACRSASICTTAKIPDADSYWRCERCGEMWNVGRRRGVGVGPRPWR